MYLSRLCAPSATANGLRCKTKIILSKRVNPITTVITMFAKKLILNLEESNVLNLSQPRAVGMANGISAGNHRRACHKDLVLITPSVQATKLKAEKRPMACRERP